MKDVDLDRLLRAAHGEAEQPAMPFGFDTRVVALWRSQPNGMIAGLTQLIRRVTLVATLVMLMAGGAIYVEAQRTSDTNEPLANKFLIADTAIADEVSP